MFTICSEQLYKFSHFYGSMNQTKFAKSNNFPIQNLDFFAEIDRAITGRNTNIEHLLTPEITLDNLRNQAYLKGETYKNREVLLEVIKEQYDGQNIPPVLSKNLESLRSEQTVSGAAAHQPLGGQQLRGA